MNCCSYRYNYDYSSAASYFSISQNDESAPPHIISIPIESPSSAAALKIQSAFRSHMVRALVGRIRAVQSDAGRMERRIQRQETVDLVRGDERERARVAESLMALLLRLDAVPGFYPQVRDLRRRAARRIVGLQEILDAVVAAPPPTESPCGFPESWEEVAEAVGRVKCFRRFLLGV